MAKLVVYLILLLAIVGEHKISSTEITKNEIVNNDDASVNKNLPNQKQNRSVSFLTSTLERIIPFIGLYHNGKHSSVEKNVENSTLESDKIIEHSQENFNSRKNVSRAKRSCLHCKAGVDARKRKIVQHYNNKESQFEKNFEKKLKMLEQKKKGAEKINRKQKLQKHQQNQQQQQKVQQQQKQQKQQKQQQLKQQQLKQQQKQKQQKQKQQKQFKQQHEQQQQKQQQQKQQQQQQQQKEKQQQQKKEKQQQQKGKQQQQQQQQKQQHRRDLQEGFKKWNDGLEKEKRSVANQITDYSSSEYINDDVNHKKQKVNKSKHMEQNVAPPVQPPPKMYKVETVDETNENDGVEEIYHHQHVEFIPLMKRMKMLYSQLNQNQNLYEKIQNRIRQNEKRIQVAKYKKSYENLIKTKKDLMMKEDFLQRQRERMEEELQHEQRLLRQHHLEQQFE
ncbi:hypothetical protein HELRODRAFT_176455 [Helobdella robusta]|uniref:Uncharacterized protein n=1 Tax=Helobdella robusta TaxID=6412 RepID=T1FAI9_HELRO|nr:hypothetical protein HELRODRAFT_176455 [Helobdella robusta]ESN99694.1 hypothetical protein HELRODRAFT_176455 [Helobdella robusta]